MFKNKDKIKEEIKSLIAKGNAILSASQNKQRVTAYLYIIFSLLALSFFGLFAIGPTFSTISDLNKKFAEEKEAYKQLQDKNAALKSLSAQYLEIEPDLNLIDNAIPQSPKVAEITRQIEILTIKNNLIVKKLDTGLMELFPIKNTNTPIFSYVFTVSVEGEEQDINNFISSIINMGRIIGVDRLTTGKQQSTLHTASITGRAYFYHSN
jgi:Tfp pilus assembly protein PilO